MYLTIGDSHLKELESLILRTVKPTGNSQTGKFIKSEIFAVDSLVICGQNTELS